MNRIYQLAEALGFGPLRPQGRELIGYCVLHGETPGVSRPSFSVRSDTGVFRCFSCGAAGLLTRYAVSQGVRVDPDLIHELQSLNAETRELRKVVRTDHRAAGYVQLPLPEGLLYALPDTGPGIADLVAEGFDPYLMRQIGIRWDFVQHRIVFPLRDASGALACLIGRAVAGGPGGQANGRPPAKYKVYRAEIQRMCKEWEVAYDAEHYEPQNHALLWLGHEESVPHGASPVNTPYVVVEGFKAALWALQAGVPRGSVCALMGSSISVAQVIQLERTGRPIMLALDNDEAGWRGTDEMVKRIGAAVYPIQYIDGRKQLDHYSYAEVRTMLCMERPTETSEVLHAQDIL